MTKRLRQLLVGTVLLAGACTTSVPPLDYSPAPPPENGCATDAATIMFDFDGASNSRCIVEGERTFSLLIAPEHAPPINPSPWYAFRYEAEAGGELTVNLRYTFGSHRYSPIWTDGEVSKPLAADVSEDGKMATLTLPAGAATVSAQEIIDNAHYRRALQRWAQMVGSEPIVLGNSIDGRPIEALRMGEASAPRLIVLLGRQHPPEVTGAIAMEAFVDQIAAILDADPAFAARYQFLVVPELNPDGTARGHWRANRGAQDLNRDWGQFTQPETRAVKQWLDALGPEVRPVLMLDFHSTFRNLFYVQGDEASESGARFLTAWLVGREADIPGYPFTIESRNANPGSGTAKNWFHETYGIPAFTYEAADDADRSGIRIAAKAFADVLPNALDTMND